MSKILPKTLIGQLMTMLVIVLLLGQFLNLMILVGEQRLQARSKTFNEAIEYSSILFERIPEDIPQNLPYYIRSVPGEPRGTFFISDTNMAHEQPDAKHLARYNLRYKELLDISGFAALDTAVTYLPYSTAEVKPSPKIRVGRNPILSTENPNFKSEEPHGRPPPPPHHLRGGPEARSGRGGPPPPPPQRGVGRKEKQEEIRVSAEIKPGIWFNAMMPHTRTESLTSRVILATSILLSLTLIAGWIFTKRLSRPLTDLRKAAEGLGRGDNPAPLKEVGPADIRMATNAFNKMQVRLSRTLETQRTMLRAIGHDFRTPLTSLRLRAENMPDDLGKDKMIATLDDMTFMTQEILNWAKDSSGIEEVASVDLNTFLASMVDDYQDQGCDVSLLDFQTVTVRIRRMAIKRAIQNLIDNALNYGNKSTIKVTKDRDFIHINFDDDGPGIPESKFSEIVKPFVRLELSRNKATGGTGLGLSIVESIIQTNGGRLTFQNIKPSGLRATLSFPA